MDQTILLLIIGGASGIGGLLIGRFAFAKNTKKQVEDAENQAASILKEAESRAENIKKEKQLELRDAQGLISVFNGYLRIKPQPKNRLGKYKVFSKGSN